MLTRWLTGAVTTPRRLDSGLGLGYGSRSHQRRAIVGGGSADVAQLVEHHLAKVRVAGSNPVVRSEPRALVERPAPACGGVAERRGNGLQSRLHGFKSRLHLVSLDEHGGGTTGREAGGAIGAVVARFPDTEEVTGSNPVSPTEYRAPGHRPGARSVLRGRLLRMHRRRAARRRAAFPPAGPARSRRRHRRRSPRGR